MTRRGLSRDEIVMRAVKLIAPAPHQLERCRDEIETELLQNAIDVAGWRYSRAIESKHSKEAAKEFSTALRNVERVAKKLPPDLSFTMFLGWHDTSPANGAEKFLGIIAKLREAADSLERVASGPPKRSARDKALAARSAWKLLREYRSQWRKMEFYRLAALLWEPAADFGQLRHQCNVILQRNRRYSAPRISGRAHLVSGTR